MLPICQFCEEEIRSKDKCILDKDSWCHELCWWKRECARLQGIIDELKDTPDGGDGTASWQRNSHRHAKHSIGSEPTICPGDEEGQEREVR